MYPQKVLQGIPDRERPIDLRILYLLVMPQADPQLVRHLLLRQAGGFVGFCAWGTLLQHLDFCCCDFSVY